MDIKGHADFRIAGRVEDVVTRYEDEGRYVAHLEVSLDGRPGERLLVVARNWDVARKMPGLSELESLKGSEVVLSGRIESSPVYGDGFDKAPTGLEQALVAREVAPAPEGTRHEARFRVEGRIAQVRDLTVGRDGLATSAEVVVNPPAKEHGDPKSVRVVVGGPEASKARLRAEADWAVFEGGIRASSATHLELDAKSVSFGKEADRKKQVQTLTI
jgi:hypothetical protein